LSCTTYILIIGIVYFFLLMSILTMFIGYSIFSAVGELTFTRITGIISVPIGKNLVELVWHYLIIYLLNMIKKQVSFSFSLCPIYIWIVYIACNWSKIFFCHPIWILINSYKLFRKSWYLWFCFILTMVMFTYWSICIGSKFLWFL